MIHEYFKDLREGKTSYLKNGNFTYNFIPKKIIAKQKNCFPEKHSSMGERAGNFFMQRTI